MRFACPQFGRKHAQKEFVFGRASAQAVARCKPNATFQEQLIESDVGVCLSNAL